MDEKIDHTLPYECGCGLRTDDMEAACNDCGEDWNFMEIVQCGTCGKYFYEDEVNENHQCIYCIEELTDNV